MNATGESDAKFQSSPAPKGGCHRRWSVLRPWPIRFQSSPAPKGGCHGLTGPDFALGEWVSILTRPEGRVPFGGLFVWAALRNEFQSSPAPKGGCHWRSCSDVTAMTRRFNPHPPRRAGAMWLAVTGWCSTSPFQSSPAPKGGCHHPSRCSTAAASRRCFNPHPPRRAGAITRTAWPSSLVIWFQSSPAPKGGCHPIASATTSGGRSVSILTRPEGRVPSSPVALPGRHPRSFNPHPPRRAGAI